MTESKTSKRDLRAVRVVRSQGRSMLVEYTDEKGNAQRCALPAGTLVYDDAGQASVDAAALAMGAPYGEDWEARIGQVSVTPAAIAAALRGSGIWTLEDARANPALVQGVLAGVYGLDLAKLLAK